MKQHQESETQEEVLPLPRNSLTPPRLLICYSSNDGPAHVKAVMQLGAFIQQYMATQVLSLHGSKRLCYKYYSECLGDASVSVSSQVCLDLWDSLNVAKDGSMAWYCRQIRESNFVLVICSWGLNHRPEPDEDKQADFECNIFSPDAVLPLIGAEVGQTKARGQDLSKYIAAIFEYSEETDIPTELKLVPHYKLTSDLPLLFSHLHQVALHRPGSYLKISHISEEGFKTLPTGAALQSAVYEAGTEMRAKRQHSVEDED